MSFTIARVRVSQEDINDTVWDESLTLDYLIPTFQGRGTCTVALIDLLVGAHNEFIEKCQSHLKIKDRVELVIIIIIRVLLLFDFVIQAVQNRRFQLVMFNSVIY